MMITSATHSAHCSVISAKARPVRYFSSSRPARFRQDRLRGCTCSAHKRSVPGKLAGLVLPAVLAVPAAWAEEVAEQAQQAVEQGKQVAEQAQQQFKLPSDLQYPSGSGLKIPKEIPSTSGLEEFISQNPAIIAAGVAVVGVGLVIAKLVGKGVNVKKLSAAKAFDLLSNESDIIFVDLRSKQEVNEAGSPDLRSIKRKITSLPYTVVRVQPVLLGSPLHCCIVVNT